MDENDRGGWLEFFCAIYITPLLRVVKKNRLSNFMEPVKVVVKEEDNAVANYSDDSFRPSIRKSEALRIDRCFGYLCKF